MIRFFSSQKDAVSGQFFLEFAAAIGQISQEPADDLALTEAG